MYGDYIHECVIIVFTDLGQLWISLIIIGIQLVGKKKNTETYVLISEDQSRRFGYIHIGKCYWKKI